MSNTDIPNKLELTCTITGKKVTWTNKAIIAKKIEQFGTLEAFVAQFKCKGAGKAPKVGKMWKGEQIIDESAVTKNPEVLKPVFENGIEMGKMTRVEYEEKYTEKVYDFRPGKQPPCLVVAPKPRAPHGWVPTAQREDIPEAI